MAKCFLYIAPLLLLLLSACGGSDQDSSPEVVDPPPAPVTTSTTGVITGFGSVFVNGVEYETDGAQLSTDDNDSASETDLQVGMVITLLGKVNDDGVTGSADEIHYEEQIKGPLESIDLAANTMKVMGQTITFDELTNLENFLLIELNLGDFLEVSGFFDDNGNLYASRIEQEDMVERLKVQGIISLLDINAQTFQLGELIVDYSGATFDGFTVQELANELVVRVKGSATELVDGVFAIDEIKLVPPEGEHAEGDARHLEGIISTVNSETNFVVNGVNVVIDDNTQYQHGTVDSLAKHVRIKVKGAFNAEGQLVASDIRIHQRSNLKVEGLIQAIDLELLTVTVHDVVFQVSEQTKMKDKSTFKVRFFDLADLAVGDFVEVKGFIENDAINIATKLDRNNSKDHIDLKGFVNNISDFTFTVLGVTVHTTDMTFFEDAQGNHVSQALFFESLQNDTFVSVAGQIIEGAFTADKIEVHHQNDDGLSLLRTELRGIVDEIAGTYVIVSDRKVTFSEHTDYKVHDERLTVEQFLALLKVGDQVKVEGLINADGVISAKTIKLEIDHHVDAAEVEFEGSGQLLDGALTVLEHRIEFDQYTTFKSANDLLNKADFLTQATQWSFFKVKGTLRDEVLFARKIEQREHDDDEENIEITALVDQLLDDGVLLARHTAKFNEQTQFFFGNLNISEADFLAKMAQGNVMHKRVKIKGDLSFQMQQDDTLVESISVFEIYLKAKD